jgi:hypothetical protein
MTVDCFFCHHLQKGNETKNKGFGNPHDHLESQRIAKYSVKETKNKIVKETKQNKTKL